MRARSSLLPPFAPVRRPRVSDQLDFEVELAVVIGRAGRYIQAGDAMDHVGGYAAFNDFSIRDYQNFGSQWIPGKNFDGSGPLGPFVVTPDEAGDPFDLDISLTIVTADGREERMQASNTSLMVHRIPDVIAFCSEWTTLEPGDVIATGTPGGVGFGRHPYRWLQPGETVLTAVERVGTLKNQVLEEAVATS
jgi:2-keto-4-pentenoate hydratase/2-oxohepta-3-ene-1,7-dioic acid hydratase in catechol pathway